jgi:hypothetical protein
MVYCGFLSRLINIRTMINSSSIVEQGACPVGLVSCLMSSAVCVAGIRGLEEQRSA